MFQRRGKLTGGGAESAPLHARPDWGKWGSSVWHSYDDFTIWIVYMLGLVYLVCDDMPNWAPFIWFTRSVHQKQERTMLCVTYSRKFFEIRNLLLFYSPRRGQSHSALHVMYGKNHTNWNHPGVRVPFTWIGRE